MKTAMQEVRDIVVKGRLDGNSDKQIVDFICLYFPDAIEKSNQEIIDAYCAGCKNSGLHKTHEEKATDYFTQKYKQ